MTLNFFKVSCIWCTDKTTGHKNTGQKTTKNANRGQKTTRTKGHPDKRPPSSKFCSVLSWSL